MSTLPHRFAAVIGIDAYGHGVAPLGSAVADATAVAAALESDHGVRSPHRLLDRAASRRGILHLLEEVLPGDVDADSGVVLYYAGHGVAWGEGGAGPEGFLLPSDARLDDASTWLSMERVRRALARLPCRHLLVILDCCFAGTFRWAASRGVVPGGRPLYDSEYSRYLSGTAWQVLTSASHDEKAQDVIGNPRGEVGEGGHSPFAAALLRGLAGEADSSRGHHAADGVITATELYQYIFEELVPAGNAGWRQTPGLWPLQPENTGEFIFLSPRGERKTRPDPPLDDAHNPWPGLSAYGAGEADLFFGREGVVGELLGRLQEGSSPLLAVIGASGSGKSSVVAAGLLPRLAALGRDGQGTSPGWTVVRAPRLEDDPREALATVERQLATAPAGGRRLLFFDQFEELYTRCPEPAARDGFCERLRQWMEPGDGGAPVRVLLTLRSDFEPRPRASAALADFLAAGCYRMPALTSEEIRAVIEGPARARGLYFEPGELVGELVDEVMAMPGALPQLCFALAEMYREACHRRRRDGALDRALTREDYAAVGGVVGALHRRADELLRAAEAGGRRETVRRVALRMVSLTGGRISRRRISRRELETADPEEQARVERVVDRLTASRLVVADRGYLEPAHDTLVQAWPQLTDWVAAGADVQPLLRALWRGAVAWEEGGRAPGLLWDGDPRLAQAQPLGPELNRLEEAFVAASGERAREEAERRLREARRLRRRAVVASLSALVAVLFLLLALGALRTAQEERDRARNGTLAAQARGHQGDRLDLALLLSLELGRQGEGFESRRLLFAALEASPRLERLLHGHGGAVRALAWSPDGRWLATAGSGPRLRLWRGEPGQGEPGQGERGEPGPARSLPAEVWSLAWSPDGRWLAAGTLRGPRLWEMDGGPDGHRLLGAETATWAVAWSPDGKTLAAAQADDTVRLWDAATGRQRGPDLGGASDWLTAVAWSPDGRVVAAAGMDRTIRRWDATTGEPLGPPFRGHAEGVTSLAWGEDGLLASGSLDGTVLLWDGATGRPLGEPFVPFPGAGGPAGGAVAALAWAGTAEARSGASGARSGALAIGGADGTVALWDPRTRRLLSAPLDGQRAPLHGLAWSPDGRTLASGNGRTVVLWSPGTGPRLGRRIELGATEVRCPALDPRGTTLAAEARDPVSQELTVRRWDAATGEPRGAPLPGLRRRAAALAWSPDGSTLTAVGTDRTLHRWQLLTGRMDAGRPLGGAGSGGAPGRLAHLAWSPDGSRLAGGHRDGSLSLWHGIRGEALGPARPGHEAAITALAWSPDGRELATGAADGTLRRWDGETGETRGEGFAGGGTAVTTLAWSPGGGTLAAGSRAFTLGSGEEGPTLRLWDVNAGRGERAPPPIDLPHTADVTDLRWSPDGRTLAVAGHRGLALWDGPRRELLAELPAAHADAISGLAWSGDGGVLLSISLDGTLMRWDLDALSWRRRACEIAGRNLSADEWQHFLPGRRYQKTCPELPSAVEE